MARPRIHLEVIGRVEDEIIRHVLLVLEDFYGRLREELRPELVEVKLFPTRDRMLAFLASESPQTSHPFDEAYIAMHEAWTGIPKIHVCAEDFKRLPRKVFDAALLHEAGHSALHGNPKYYVVTIPASLAEEFRGRGFTEEEVMLLAYLEASSLKDLEVSSLLKSLGYLENQAVFILYNLEVEEEEVAAWKIASHNPKTRLLYLAHMLKALATSIPFLSEPEWASQVWAKRREACSHLDEKSLKILSSLEEALQKARGDFQEKVVYLLRETLKRVRVEL